MPGIGTFDTRNGMAAIAMVVATAWLAGATPAHARCDDYATQAEAQAAMEAGETRLDRDKDGIACENNPGAPSASRRSARSASQHAGSLHGSTSGSDSHDLSRAINDSRLDRLRKQYGLPAE